MVALPDGMLGIEIKNRATTSASDCRSLRAVAGALGNRWRGGMVVYRGEALRPIDQGLDIWALPVARLFA